MTTAIKTTKQKSPEACYDKVILKAKQIHSYIDFQEDKFNGKKTQQLDYLNNSQSHLWKKTNTQTVQLQSSSTVIIPTMSTQEFPASLDQLLIK